MTVGNFVHDIFLKLNKDEKDLLGVIPCVRDLEREITNYKKYLKTNKISRKRTRFGEIAYDQNIPVGYICFTNLSYTSPIKYEKDFIGLNKNLNYIHLRQLVIGPEFRNKKIGTNLVNVCLEFAERHEKSVVGDVKIENKKIISLFEVFGFREDFGWKTPSGTKMIRFLRE